MSVAARARGTASAEGADGPYRVMIADDSAVVRGLFARYLEAESDVAVVASVGNGQLAVQALDRHDVELVILDIEMPVMDGMTALPLLLQKKPDLKVLMASTLTARNAAISLKALSIGASEYVTKPSSSGSLHKATDFKRELIDKVRALGATARKGGLLPKRARAAAPPAPAKGLYSGAKVTLRPQSTNIPGVLAIGSSTGGPQALFTIFGLLKGQITCPIFITQHMPPTFTKILAENLENVSGIKAAEAEDGERVTSRRIYVAPGDHHMMVVGGATDAKIKLTKDPPENFCRPAVDPMFRSLAAVYKGRVLGVVLTGMGSDGTKGAKHIVEANGTVIAQDEATSVVWGMPGSAATAGLCSKVLQVSDIAPHLVRTFRAG